MAVCTSSMRKVAAFLPSVQVAIRYSRYWMFMTFVSTLSSQERCCDLQINGSTKKLLKFMYKDVVFHKKVMVTPVNSHCLTNAGKLLNSALARCSKPTLASCNLHQTCTSHSLLYLHRANVGVQLLSTDQCIT